MFFIKFIIALLLLNVSAYCKEKTAYELLDKIENIGPVQYDAVTTNSTKLTNGKPFVSKMKVWQNPPYYRFESVDNTVNVKVITIIHPDTVYIYDSKEDKFHKIPNDNLAKTIFGKSPEDLGKEAKKSTDAKIAGSQKINGHLTTVIEYSTKVQALTVLNKMWIWNEKNMPIKTKTTMKLKDENVITEILYENIKFGDFPKNVFEVPKNKLVK